MKIIDAYWEKRNLGVTTQECIIEEQDSIEDVLDKIDQLNAQYQVIKTPIGRLDYYNMLAQKGFFFVEAIIKVSYALTKNRNTSLQPVIERLRHQITYGIMSDQEKEIMFSQISSGMFKTDRIYLDPMFKNSQAANRYIWWMKDEIEKKAYFYSYRYLGKTIGFICGRKLDNTFHALLGGVYNFEKKLLPLGGVIHLKQLEIAKELGMQSFITYISSNNLPVVRTYSINEYDIDGIYYVFVKHA